MKIVYMVTDLCNANCPHCYKKVTGSPGKGLEQCEAEILSLMQDRHEIIVAGREVLCELEKIKLYNLVGQDYLLTNGILLAKSPVVLDELRKYGIKKINISWHYGFAALADQVSESVIVEAINNSRQAKFEIHINCVIGNTNYNLLPEMFDVMMNAGVNGVRLIKLIQVNDEMTPFIITEHQRKKVIQDVVKLKNFYDKKVFLIRMHPNFEAIVTKKSLQAKRDCLLCQAGRDFIVIDTDNAIYPCPFLQEDRFRIGRFIDGRIELDTIIENNGRNCIVKSLYANGHKQKNKEGKNGH